MRDLFVSRGYSLPLHAELWGSPRQMWRSMVQTGVADTMLGASTPLDAARLAHERGWMHLSA